MPSRTCSFGCIVGGEQKRFVVRLDLMLQRAKIIFVKTQCTLCRAFAKDATSCDTRETQKAKRFKSSPL